MVQHLSKYQHNKNKKHKINKQEILDNEVGYL